MVSNRPLQVARLTVVPTVFHVGWRLNSCDGRVFDVIRATDPLFFLALGDWTYGNINRNDASRFQARYDLNLTAAPAQAALYAQAWWRTSGMTTHVVR
jgi:hypothetical protein